MGGQESERHLSRRHLQPPGQLGHGQPLTTIQSQQGTQVVSEHSVVLVGRLKSRVGAEVHFQLRGAHLRLIGGIQAA